MGDDRGNVLEEPTADGGADYVGQVLVVGRRLGGGGGVMIKGRHHDVFATCLYLYRQQRKMVER